MIDFSLLVVVVVWRVSCRLFVHWGSTCSDCAWSVILPHGSESVVEEAIILSWLCRG
ncbi:hypothetical protein KC19_8G138500 [Ceratodon purpureus]|uniref:Secreted protein n=1 Tax=Ceratodon purpureus TaxID=3225 RepID=A0A8T0H213_CERPU|nr:hypothetical protein KC19_8G138100 [Ceratodon purpureus]KAG0564769.1 hypothetical protein KC19_8G138500 [Ceratodon purpureus]